MHFCPCDMSPDNSSCASSTPQAHCQMHMLCATKVNLLNKKRLRLHVKVKFYLMALMNERVKKPSRQWADQQEQRQLHNRVPHISATAISGSRARVSAALWQGWYTVNLPKVTSALAETCISLNTDLTITVFSRTTLDISPRRVIMSWQLTVKHTLLSWNLVQRDPAWW